MNGFGNWLRSFAYKLRMGLSHMMRGRYGTDKLNMAILGAGIACTVLSMLIPVAIIKLLLTTVSYIFMILAIIRTMSRNVYKRYEENRKFCITQHFRFFVSRYTITPLRIENAGNRKKTRFPSSRPKTRHLIIKPIKPTIL